MTWSQHHNNPAFTPHGHCYLWQDDLVILHAASDFLIGLAYFSIPLALWVFVKKRKDLAFNWMFMLFASFIFACGATHFMDVWNVWHTDYYLSGVIKGLTAAVSVVTAALLWPLIPRAMALPSPASLQATNQRLNNEIARRHEVEEELRYAGERLEQRVVERTRELEEAKEALEREVVERRMMENRFRKLFESSPHGIMLIDRSGTVRLANQQAGDILDYASEVLEGYRAEQILVPDTENASPEEVNLCLVNNPASWSHNGTQWFGMCRKGGKVPLELAVNSLASDSEADIIVSMVDISERKEAEEERERLMEQLRDAAVEADRNRGQMEAVFESIHDAVAVFDMDYNLVMVNSALTAVNGLPGIPDKEHTIDYFFRTYELFDMHGRPLSTSEWPVSRVLRGESLNEWELQGYRRDTGQGWYFSYSGAPVFDEHGEQILGVVVRRNITERKHLEQARKESERRLQLAVSIAQLGFWEWDIATDDVYFSPEWKQQLGYEAHELGGTREIWKERLHPEDRERALNYLMTYIEQPTSEYRLEYRLRHRDGSYRWMLASATPDIGPSGQAEKLMGTQLDITESKLAEQRVIEAAKHDPLTGLPNRALIFEYAHHLLASARRHHRQVAFLFIDLDRFKPVNDLYGHEVGDQLLQELANRLVDCVREEDLVGRLGGDEFLVVLSPTAAYSVGAVAQHILEVLARPFHINGLDILVSGSIGISLFPRHGADVGTLIRNADLAMYQSKHDCRGHYQMYTPDLNGAADVSASIEAKIKFALHHDGLALHYQPVVDMNSGTIIGAEALLRLTTEEGKGIGPQEFIPVAESAGLIAQLGEWVASEACRQHEEWIKCGLPPVTVAINVSPLQFRQRDFLERLQNILRHSTIDPQCFQIEVTETAVMDNVDEAITILNDIRDMGVRIALDDFGTGYSSLSYLSSLPLDKLKVDQSFVMQLENDRTSRAITAAIIALGRTLNLEVVGEGIESERALTYLKKNGCNQAQGFYISRPMLPTDFARWYRENGRLNT